MILQINIDKEAKTAGMSIKDANDSEIQWQDLEDADKVSIINTLFGFTNLFQKTYVQEHSSEPVEETEDAEEVSTETPSEE